MFLAALGEFENPGQANDDLTVVESESMSEYFHHKTSNLGHSLGSNSGSKLSIARPDFGLQIQRSPKPKPVAMVTAADIVQVR